MDMAEGKIISKRGEMDYTSSSGFRNYAKQTTIGAAAKVLLDGSTYTTKHLVGKLNT